MYITKLEKAEHTELKAIPARINLTESACPLTFARIITPAAAARAPKNAIIPIELLPKTAPTPARTASVAPSDAPDEIPRIYGSARGFFTIACITTPHTDSPMPAPTAKIIRGRRINHTTSCTAPFPNAANFSMRNTSYPITL